MNKSETAQTIRYPATANLMIDSSDRNQTAYSSPWDFVMTKNYSIMNGFFTRVGTTEVVLDWCEDNVSNYFDNTVITWDLSGTGANPFSGNIFPSIPEGLYTVEEVLDVIVARFNLSSGVTGMTMSVNSTNYNNVVLELSGGVFTTAPTDKLAIQLNMSFDPLTPNLMIVGQCADIRPYTYIDFVSPTLTYAQDLKDSSTATFVRDVLCRWYFADDVPEALDGYGFPIRMGYKSFCRRRIFNPPKQIRWDKNLPLGNITFQVYGDDGQLLDPQAESQWFMTLQFSEN